MSDRCPKCWSVFHARNDSGEGWCINCDPFKPASEEDVWIAENFLSGADKSVETLAGVLADVRRCARPAALQSALSEAISRCGDENVYEDLHAKFGHLLASPTGSRSASATSVEPEYPAIQTDDVLFAKIVSNAMHFLNLSDRDMAERFSISRPSVTRWRTGVSAPHPAMRRPVFDHLLRMIAKAVPNE